MAGDRFRQVGFVILAGGKNRRMCGEKKGFLRYDDKTFIERIRDCLKDFGTVYLSVDHAGDYHRTGLPLIEDRYPGVGPMGGICTALDCCPEAALFVVACDMPFLEKTAVDRLLEAYFKQPGRLTIASADGRLQALCGIYPRRVLPEMKRHIAEGKYKMRGFLKTQDIQEVVMSSDDRSLVNINSAWDYAAHSDEGPMDIAEAVMLLKSSVDPVCGVELAGLSDALGRVLAEDVAAGMDQPPFPRSPLDGYALRAEDSTGALREHPVSLKVIGKIYAGQVFDGRIGPGECIRLMTGAPIPDGADTVIRQEDTDYGESVVRIYAELKAYQNYCVAGDDFRRGDRLVRSGTRLGSAALSVAAGCGLTALPVLRKARVAVISTGDEIIPAGRALPPGKIYDTNLPFVTSRLAELGGTVVTGLHSDDEVSEMARKIRDLAADHDLIITTGGVSVGEKDIMHGVLEALEAKKLFWRVKIKPGAPTLAFVYDGTLVICLTGNPYGVMVNFELLVRPVLEKLTGGAVTAGRCEQRVLAADSPKRGKMPRFLKGMADEKGVAFSEGSQGSGTISAMAACNCYIELPAGSSGKKGETVWVHFL